MLKFLFFIIFVTVNGWSYIPSADFIFSRMTTKAGKGSYKITQELLFQAEDQSSSVKEVWTIKDGSTYFLEVRGKSFVKYFVYKGGQRLFIDDLKQIKSSPLPPEFFENLFLARDSSALKKDLINKKIIPSKSLRPLVRPKNLKEVKYTPDSYVHLTRNRGAVNYTFMDAEDFNETSTTPALWVEQDRFNIRRIRLPTLVDVSADDYSDFSQGLSYPKSRRVSWNNNTVQIELLRADSVNIKDDIFNSNYLKTLTEKTVSVEDSKTKPLIEEFYSRFR